MSTPFGTGLVGSTGPATTPRPSVREYLIIALKVCVRIIGAFPVYPALCSCRVPGFHSVAVMIAPSVYARLEALFQRCGNYLTILVLLNTCRCLLFLS